MTAKTKIEWADATWNPVTGCTRVSPGCRLCYAERIATNPRYARHYPDGFSVREHPERLKIPATWKTPKFIFVNSMSDLFHREISDDFLARIWHTITTEAPQHTYLILTKRAHRMQATITRLGLPLLPNIWLGFSAENQKFYDSRLPPLTELASQAPRDQIFFVSCEPLLGPIDLRLTGASRGPDTNPISWIIAAGESGTRATPMDPSWAASLRDQCQQAGIPYFLKQLGGYPSKRGGELAILDGTTHTERPTTARTLPTAPAAPFRQRSPAPMAGRRHILPSTTP